MTAPAEPRVVEEQIRIETARGPELVQAWVFPDNAPHFAIHRDTLCQEKWRVTHVPSGHRFNIAFAQVPEAVQFLVWILEGAPDGARTVLPPIDWSKPAAQIAKRHPSIERLIQSRIAWWHTLRARRLARKLKEAAA